jgi:hypothetical protein
MIQEREALSQRGSRISETNVKVDDLVPEAPPTKGSVSS